MKLSEIQPKEVDFEVCGMDLTFRPYTISDDLKFQEIYKDLDEDPDHMAKVFLTAWYQLTLASQKKVVATESVYMDPETGKEKKAGFSPIQKFRSLFLGAKSHAILINNLFKCRGLNLPDIKDDTTQKKWVGQLKTLPLLTGQ